MAVKIDFTWPKAAALATVQAVVHTAIPMIVGNNVLHMAWDEVIGLSLASGLVALGGAVLAYTLPGVRATAAVSAPVGAAQLATQTQEVVEAIPVVHDADGARG